MLPHIIINEGRRGGAIFIMTSSIQSSNNRASAGGAIYSQSTSQLFTVTDCSFSSNIASLQTGGAMRLYSPHLTVVHSSFDNTL